ncbi:MAG: ORF6N domain-containing protein [Burkholderiales bacterium]
MSVPLVRAEVIAERILLVRGQKVMLDADLAALYEVPTKRLNEQVKRNADRFPADFMFRLTAAETELLNRSQFATGSQKHRDPRFTPLVFTEHGAIMAATVLNSARAVEVSIYVVRAFVQQREFLASHKDLARELRALEMRVTKKFAAQDETIKDIIGTLRELMTPPDPTKRPIGFVIDEKDSKPDRKTSSSKTDAKANDSKSKATGRSKKK